MKLSINQDYRLLRHNAYPSLGDQLDAIFKLAKHLSDSGVELPEDVLSWINDCQSTKEAYPKL